ncbi:hypothetical protein B0H11DRAFT_2428869, partial [Mycena galericulata]
DSFNSRSGTAVNLSNNDNIIKLVFQLSSLPKACLGRGDIPGGVSLLSLRRPLVRLSSFSLQDFFWAPFFSSRLGPSLRRELPFRSRSVRALFSRLPLFFVFSFSFALGVRVRVRLCVASLRSPFLFVFVPVSFRFRSFVSSAFPRFCLQNAGSEFNAMRSRELDYAGSIFKRDAHGGVLLPTRYVAFPPTLTSRHVCSAQCISHSGELDYAINFEPDASWRPCTGHSAAYTIFSPNISNAIVRFFFAFEPDTAPQINQCAITLPLMHVGGALVRPPKTLSFTSSSQEQRPDRWVQRRKPMRATSQSTRNIPVTVPIPPSNARVGDTSRRPPPKFKLWSSWRTST